MIFPETKWVLLFQQASAKEIDDRKPQLDKITRRAEELSKSADQYDSERIKKQVSSMSTLWSNVCRLLSTSMQSLADIVRHFEQFSRLHETLSHWLLTIESSVSRELEESFLSIPDDQGDTVFQVWLFVCLFVWWQLSLRHSIRVISYFWDLALKELRHGFPSWKV